MSRTYRRKREGQDDLRVRAIRKDPADLRRLARALIELVQLQEEAEAEQQHKRRKRQTREPRPGPSEQSSNESGDAA